MVRNFQTNEWITQEFELCGYGYKHMVQPPFVQSDTELKNNRGLGEGQVH